jgi:hypothetical protein
VEHGGATDSGRSSRDKRDFAPGHCLPFQKRLRFALLKRMTLLLQIR